MIYIIQKLKDIMFIIISCLIKYIEENNTYKYLLENKDAQIDFKLDVIMADNEYQKIFNNLIGDLLYNKKCFNSTFIGCSDIYDSSYKNISFYYCHNDENIMNDLKKRILPIKFFTNEYNNYTFEIINKDILEKKGDYIIIKIVFPKFSYSWTLGRPFSLKYKFIFNPDLKQIGFIIKSNKEK